MKPMYVYDKLNGDEKEVAMINFVEEYILLWTNTTGARVTTERRFDQIKELD